MRRWLLVIGMALALPALAACGQEASGTLGSPVTAGDYELTASNVENPAQPPDRFTNPKPGNRFVKVDVSIDNPGQQHLPVAANYFVIRDSGGIDNPALAGVPSDRGLKSASIAPGQHFQTALYFEMAANLHPQQLVFSPSVVGWRTKILVDLPS